MIRGILRLLYPPKCIFCGKVVENDRFAVCEVCKESVPFNRRACKVCGTPLDTVYGDLVCTDCAKRRQPFQGAYVPFIYKDNVRNAILRFKFGGRRASAVTMAAYMLLKMRELKASRPDVITFVPMHPVRLGTRGFNQAQLLAKALGEMLHVPVLSYLRRTKYTKPQSKRRERERQYAVQGVFALRKNADVGGKKILLIDDVITTGATLSACARVLKKGGAASVEISTVAATSFVRK